MSLKKRGKTWWVDFVTPSGKRVRRSTGSRRKTEAQEYHDKLKAEYWRIETLGAKPDYFWKDAALKWLEEKNHKATIDQDRRKLARLDQWLGTKRMVDIDRALVQQIGHEILSDSGNTSANRYLALLKSILRKAWLEWEWLERAPKVTLYPEPKKRIRFLTQQQAHLLISFLPDHQKAMVRFSLATGIRQGNLLGLKWSDVDVQAKTMRIHADEFKGRRAIGLPLNEDAIEVLALVHGQHDEYVFTYRGNPIGQCNTKAFRKALKKAGIENFVWHDLRHTWASWHIQAGTPMAVLQELGGWESMKMVQKYAHLSTEHLAPHAESIICGTKMAQPTSS